MCGGEKMNTVWAQRREEVLRDCIVSPDVFTQMVDRLGEFVVPYQHALDTEPSNHHMHLIIQGWRPNLPRKNAEKRATLFIVERRFVQTFKVIAPAEHLPWCRSLANASADS